MDQIEVFWATYWLIIFIVLVVHVLVCMAIAEWAQRKGREYLAFFFIAFFFSEIVAFIIVASIAPSPSVSLPVRGQTRKCPYCAEEILAEAKKCFHCMSDVEPELPVKAAPREIISEPSSNSQFRVPVSIQPTTESPREAELTYKGLITSVTQTLNYEEWAKAYEIRATLSGNDAHDQMAASANPQNVWTELHDGDAFFLVGRYLPWASSDQIISWLITERPRQLGHDIIVLKSMKIFR